MPFPARHLLSCAFVLAMLVPARAQQKLALEDMPLWRTAQQALADGLSAVAALKAQRVMEIKGLTKKSRATVAGLWVEALVRAERGDEAMLVLKTHEVPNHFYWLGHALLLTNDFEPAGKAFEQVATDSPMHEFALLGRAHALMGDGREGAARTIVKPLRSSPNEIVARNARLLFNELELSTNRASNVVERLSHERGGKDATVQFLRARARMQLNEFKTSEAILRDLLATPSSGMNDLTHDAATLLLVEVLARQHSPDARTTLFTFLNGFGGSAERPRDSEFWGEAFAILRTMADAQDAGDESLITPVLPWAIDATVPNRQGYALHFVAIELHRQQRDTESISLLETLLALYPKHPMAGESLRLAMQLHGAQRSDARVLQLAERWRQQFGGGGGAVVDFLVGLIQFARGEHLAALHSFTKAGDAETDLPRRRRALYNAAICALKAGKESTLLSLMAQLDQAAKADDGKHSVASENGADVRLDRALQLASQIDPRAEEELTAFIKSQSKHARWVEANVALAEFSLLDVPPRVKTATEALAAATSANPNPGMQERIGYLRVWLAEARQTLTDVVREGQAYLAAWPQSQRADEMQMKVAEAFYRLESYAKARTEFELLAKNRPASAYADSAQFYAGLSAMAIPSTENLNAAISAWEELAQRGGPLAFAARRHQAIATLRKGDKLNTLKLLDNLIADADASADDRLSLQCEKAGLLISLGRQDTKQLDNAVTTLRTLLDDKTLRYLWSGRCGVLLATALHEQTKNDEALEACYDVINVGSNILTTPQNPAEYLWYYRAGFLAIDLLEAKEQWETAARMAERLAQSGGSRAKEAAERATKIRLQHFLWDGNK